MATLETRVISGRGILRLDSDNDDYKKAKIFTLYVDVIRRPLNEYINLAYNEPQSRYATIRLYRGVYCVQTIRIETLSEAFDFYSEPAAQTLYAVQCAYAGTLQTFFNLGNALLLPSISVTNHIANWRAVDLMWDEAKVVCYADTGIRLSVRTTPFDLCPDQEDKDKDPPPPPPENNPALPPGTPLDDSSIPVSPAYDGDTDDGNTVPYPDDYPPTPEFPTGERCVGYLIAYSFQPVGGGVRVEGSQPHFGEIEYVGIDPGDGRLGLIISHGLILTPGSPCLPNPTGYNAGSASAGIVPDSFLYTITPL